MSRTTIRLRSRLPFVCVGILGLVAWLSWVYLRALGQAFGNAPADPEVVNFIIVSVVVASVACSLVALLKSSAAARWIALAPLALVGMGELSINWVSQQRRSERREERAAVAEDIAARVAEMPRTYVQRDGDGGGREFFLFVDEEAGFLMHVERGPHVLSVRCMGSVRGRTLSMAEASRLRENSEAYLSLFSDEHGRSPQENFDVVYVERLDTSRCNTQSD